MAKVQWVGFARRAVRARKLMRAGYGRKKRLRPINSTDVSINQRIEVCFNTN